MQALRAGKVINVVATADYADGDVVVVGDLVGIANGSGVAGSTYAADVEGVFELPCAVAIAQGKVVYWDTVNKTVVAAEAANTVKLGHAWETVASAAGSVPVKIN